ncbi:TPA: hypothetical protein U1D11_000253 [Streptococcus suis]|nr:hypothetical protein [Streptococcus suis]
MVAIEFLGEQLLPSKVPQTFEAVRGLRRNLRQQVSHSLSPGLPRSLVVGRAL